MKIIHKPSEPPTLKSAFNSLTKKFQMKVDIISSEFDEDVTLYSEIVDLGNPVEDTFLFFFKRKYPNVVAYGEDLCFSIKLGYITEIIELLQQAEKMAKTEVTVIIE